MSEKPQTQEEHDQEQEMLQEREAHRMEMMHANLNYGNMRGIGGIIIWGIIVAIIFGLMYFLSLS